MRELYGEGTYAPCTECGRKIFITEAEVTVRDGKRLVDLICKSPGCVAYALPRLTTKARWKFTAQREPDRPVRWWNPRTKTRFK